MTGALVLEGSLVGALGGLAGIVAGSGLAFGLVALLGSLDLGLPPAHVTMSPWTALIALVVATGVTTVAVLIPAIRGARVPPVAALRDAAVEPVGLPRVRTIIGFVLTGLGAVGVVVGDPWPILVFGSLALFLGVFLAGPAMALGWSRVAHAVLRHLGVAPRLAADNLGRHPRRTSATSNALVVGLLLVTLVSVAGNSLKSWAVEQVNQLTSADFIVATMPGVELPTDVLDRMSATPGVTGLVALETVTVSDGGRPTTISAATSAKDLDALDLKTSKGSLDDLRGGIAVPDQGPDTPKFGSTVAYALTDGRSVDLEVTAIIEPSLDAYVLGALAEPATLARLSATPPKRTTALVTVTKGATERVGNAFKKIVASTNVFVIEGNFLGQMVGSVFDFFINVVNGLLGISVLVALIGIVNTLSLAIHERRHELGLLRAVGMSARHVRRSVRVESVLMSVLGTLVGVATGIFLGWGLTRAIDLGFAMPWRRMGIILGLGIAIGGVASILPTVRATRGEIVDAIAS